MQNLTKHSFPPSLWANSPIHQQNTVRLQILLNVILTVIQAYKSKYLFLSFSFLTQINPQIQGMLKSCWVLYIILYKIAKYNLFYTSTQPKQVLRSSPCCVLFLVTSLSLDKSNHALWKFLKTLIKTSLFTCWFDCVALIPFHSLRESFSAFWYFPTQDILWFTTSFYSFVLINSWVSKFLIHFFPYFLACFSLGL